MHRLFYLGLIFLLNSNLWAVLDCTDFGGDTDRDGKCDFFDLCPNDPQNSCIDLGDGDNDKVPKYFDNCPQKANADQKDTDKDGIGDACDDCIKDFYNDIDDDGICADEDNCPFDYNPHQDDEDKNGIGDDCDDIEEGEDEAPVPVAGGPAVPVPTVPPIVPPVAIDPREVGSRPGRGGVAGEAPVNRGPKTPQAPNPKNDGKKNEIDEDKEDEEKADDDKLVLSDSDRDGIMDNKDNCPKVSNSSQEDKDKNGVGDACETAPTKKPVKEKEPEVKIENKEKEAVPESEEALSGCSQINGQTINNNLFLFLALWLMIRFKKLAN